MNFRDDIDKILGGNVKVNNGHNNWEAWLQFYRGEAFYLDAETASLNLPSAISSEFGMLATLEMESSVEDEVIDIYYKKILKEIRKIVEYGMALGDVIIKPYIADEGIAFDVVTPDLFVPLEHDSSKNISRIGFIDRFEKEKKFYTKVEVHTRTVLGYEIENMAFVSGSDRSLGDRIDLKAVDKWRNFAEKTIIRGYKGGNLFGHFKNSQANNLDLKSPMGISCFARAVSLIQDADEQYSRILWEYEGSELAVDADLTALINSEELPRGKERLFRNLGIDQPEGFYKVFSPAIRDSSLFNGLNKILQRIEFVCGLAYGTISDLQETTKTASEIKFGKQRSYATVTDIQSALEICLRDTVNAICVWVDIKNGIEGGAIDSIKVRTEFPEVSFTFDDSIIVDSAVEQNMMLKEVSAGILKPEIYLMKRYGVTEKEAKEMLPVLGDEYDEEVEEIE